jgi:protease-4
MKTFFVSLLGTLVGLTLFFAGLFVVGLALIGAVVSHAGGSSKAVPEVEPGAYLVFNLNANLTDAPPEITTGGVAGLLTGNAGGPATLQVRAVTRALRAAAKDDRIAGVFLTGSLAPDGLGTGYAALKEVRAALQDFKAAKKPVVAHLELATARDFYLTAGADDLVLDPFGAVFMPGLASEPIFFAGALEKYGVGVQVTRVGRYKSAVEPYTRTDMSPESREQLQKLLNDLWSELLGDAAADRGLKPAELQALSDSEGLIRADAAMKAKLVTRVAYRDVVIAELKEKTGQKNSDQPFKQVSLADYADMLEKPMFADAMKKTPHVAIVYAEGTIVDGEGALGDVGGARFARELRRLREDDSVKAVVLRVNSPGGAVTASEQIGRELSLMRAVKPVVVSMGSYAASGGYWISAGANRIFAENASITGSIGVFGLQFDVQKLANGFGVTFDTVKTGKFADLETIARPKTPEELAVAQQMVDWIYGEFITRVADGRKLDPAKVREIAEGRVWSGAAALPLGLVDEIGGLDAALAFAAKEAKLDDDYAVEEFPRSRDLAEVITALLEHETRPAARTGGVAAQLMNELQSQARALGQFNDPRGLYARLPFDLRLR